MPSPQAIAGSQCERAFLNLPELSAAVVLDSPNGSLPRSVTGLSCTTPFSVSIIPDSHSSRWMPRGARRSRALQLTVVNLPSSGNIWPPHPVRLPSARRRGLASRRFSTVRRSLGRAAPCRLPSGLGQSQRDRTSRRVRCSRKKVAGNSPVFSHGLKFPPFVALGMAGKPGASKGRNTRQPWTR